jgi:hypothetical protein
MLVDRRSAPVASDDVSAGTIAKVWGSTLIDICGMNIVVDILVSNSRQQSTIDKVNHYSLR